MIELLLYFFEVDTSGSRMKDSLIKIKTFKTSIIKLLKYLCDEVRGSAFV